MEEQLFTVFSQHASDVDDHLLEYLSGMALEHRDSSEEDLVEVLGDILISYGAVEDEQGAQVLVRALWACMNPSAAPSPPAAAPGAAESSTNSGVDQNGYEEDDDGLDGDDGSAYDDLDDDDDDDDDDDGDDDSEEQAPAWEPMAGARCEARYYEDGKWYPATIQQMMPAIGKAKVLFAGYGNVETVSLEDDLRELPGAAADAAPGALRLNAPVQIDVLHAEDEANKKRIKKRRAARMRKDPRVSMQEIRQRNKIKERAEAKRKHMLAGLERMRIRREEQARLRKERALEVYLSNRGSRRDMSVDIEAVSLSTYDGGKQLLDHAHLKIVEKRRYGLIGRNGIGKSTLMTAIANYEVDGFPQHIRTALVEQEVKATGLSVLDTVISSDLERKLLLDEEARLTALKGGRSGDGDGDGDGNGAEEEEDAESQRLVEVYKALDEIDAWTAEARAIEILRGLQFDDETMHVPTNTLSGGWRMRVELASGLFQAPDILLLDEPSNNLDFAALLWLEDYLNNYPRTVIVVSHDRVFLNNVITDVIYFNSKKKLEYYRGNYDTFEKVRAEEFQRRKREYDAQQLKRSHMQTFVDKFRYNAKRASLVQSRIKALNRLEVLEEVLEDPTFALSFPEPNPISGAVVTTNGLKVGYDPSKVLLKNVTVNVQMGSRIGVVGVNGVGKSTLIKTLMGELEQLAGEKSLNGSAKIAYFTQHHVDQLEYDLSPMEMLAKRYPGAKDAQIRAQLGRFGLVDDLALQPIRCLSGGQRSRVSFSILSWDKPVALFLDEVSNHLDIETSDALIVALSSFSGAIVLISHDKHLLSNVCDEFWAVSNQRVKHLTDFDAAMVHCFGRTY